MNVKVGYQTNIWGRSIQDLPKLLESLWEYGFKGIEISQRPCNLGGIKNSHELAYILGDFGIELLGMAGGTVEERLEYLGNHFQNVYLHVRDLQDLCDVAQAQNGFSPAIHPHIYRDFQTMEAAEKAVRLFSANKNVKLIVDTAHLLMAGELDYKPTEDIIRERIAAIHLKNWAPDYGRSAHNYARGFKELEKDGPVAEVFKGLLKAGFNGWVLCEQDSSYLSAQLSLKENVSVMKHYGLSFTPNKSRTYNFSEHRNHLLSSDVAPTPFLQNEKDLISFYEDIGNAAQHNVDLFFEKAVSSLVTLTGCTVASIWACPRGKDFLSLMALSPSYDDAQLNKTPRIAESLALETLRSQKTCYFSKADIQQKTTCISYHFSLTRNVKSMISIPVVNPRNMNHIIYVINLLFDRELNNWNDTDKSLYAIAQHIALTADMVLHDACSSAAGKVDLINPAPANLAQLLNNIHKTAKELSECEATSLFLLDEEKIRLCCVTPESVKPLQSDTLLEYSLGENITGKVWKRMQPYISFDPNCDNAGNEKCKELDISKDRWNLMAHPLIDNEQKVVGVLRCANKLRKSGSSKSDIFTDNDVALVEAALQAFAPRLKLFLRDLQNQKTQPSEISPSRTSLKEINDSIMRLATLNPEHFLIARIRSDDELAKHFIESLLGVNDATWLAREKTSLQSIVQSALDFCENKRNLRFLLKKGPNSLFPLPDIKASAPLLRWAFCDILSYASDQARVNLYFYAHLSNEVGRSTYNFCLEPMNFIGGKGTWIAFKQTDYSWFFDAVFSNHRGNIFEEISPAGVTRWKISFPVEEDCIILRPAL